MIYLCARVFSPLNTKLNPICRLLALLRDHHIFHVSRIRVNDTVRTSRSGCIASNMRAVNEQWSTKRWIRSYNWRGEHCQVYEMPKNMMAWSYRKNARHRNSKKDVRKAVCNKTKRKTKNEMTGWRVHGPEKDWNKRMEGQSKGSRGLEAYCKGGQGPPRAVAPSKKTKNE